MQPAFFLADMLGLGYLGETAQSLMHHAGWCPVLDFHVHFADDPDYSRYNFGQLNFWRVLSLATLWHMNCGGDG